MEKKNHPSQVKPQTYWCTFSKWWSDIAQ